MGITTNSTLMVLYHTYIQFKYSYQLNTTSTITYMHTEVSTSVNEIIFYRICSSYIVYRHYLCGWHAVGHRHPRHNPPRGRRASLTFIIIIIKYSAAYAHERETGGPQQVRSGCQQHCIQGDHNSAYRHCFFWPPSLCSTIMYVWVVIVQDLTYISIHTYILTYLLTYIHTFIGARLGRS